jgi:oxalate decarboxylase/phosphoglucose isomerase-like protein (cupin superfamily)
VLAGPFLTSGCLGAAAYGSHPSSANFVASARFSGGRCTDIERRRVAARHQGRVSVSLFGSDGRYRIERLQKGDVGCIAQGYGHSIENIDSGPARILIGFNAGIYETIDLPQWIAANPTDVLATNFGQPAEVFGKLPDTRRVHRR